MRKNDREQIAARDALELMVDANVPPTPDNFNLFFRCAAGEETAVSNEIRKMLASGQCFTDSILHDLRERVSAHARAQITMTNVGQKITEVMNSVLENIESTGRDAEAYGQTLSAASHELGSRSSHTEIQKLMNSLIGATQTMAVRTNLLESELERSSLEVKELKLQLDNVRKESLTDPLTDVYNRKAFDAEIASAIICARECHEPLSLLMCDIDRFKVFNDTWGHQTGDHVLRLVAACLSQNVKGRDTVARYGGEEFAVVLRQTALDDAIRIADQIRATVERKKLVKRSTGEILGALTVSVGVAQFAPTDTEADFVGRADRYLYAAKHAGRNQVIGSRHSPLD